MSVDTAAETLKPPNAPGGRAYRPHGVLAYFNCFRGIVWREVLRFLHQRERFLSALVRPLVWLFIFAAGFRQVLGISIIPPYETYITYDVYITPGLLAMIQLFNGMQSSLSMVYDREMGNMRTLSPVLSPMLWTSIATGKRAHKHGIYGFAEPVPGGDSVRPVTNLSRKCKAIWNILSERDRTAGVIGVNTPYTPRTPMPPTEMMFLLTYEAG